MRLRPDRGLDAGDDLLPRGPGVEQDLGTERLHDLDRGLEGEIGGVGARADAKVLRRRYRLSFADPASVLWKQHRPCELYADKALRDVLDAHKGEKITIKISTELMKQIAKEGIQWTKDPDWGYEVPVAVPGVDLAKYDPRRHYPAEEYAKLVDKLRGERREWLAKFPGASCARSRSAPRLAGSTLLGGSASALLNAL